MSDANLVPPFIKYSTNGYNFPPYNLPPTITTQIPGTSDSKPPERRMDQLYITSDNWDYWNQKLTAAGYDTTDPTQWAGKMMSSGYWDATSAPPGASGQEGETIYLPDGVYQMLNGKWWKWNEQKDMSNIANQLIGMQNTQAPNLMSYDNLINEMNAARQQLGGTDWSAEALQYAAERLGFTDAGAMSSSLQDMFQQMSQGIAGQQGMTAQEQADYERQTALGSQGMKEDARMLMEALTSQGRSTRALNEGIQLSREIADFQASRFVEESTMNFARKQAEYAALEQRWQGLLSAGNMGTQEYLNAQETYWTTYMTSLSQELEAVGSANQEALTAYATNAQLQYTGILAELGVDEQMLSMSNEWWNQYMAPYYNEMQIKAAQDAANAQKSAADAGAAAGIFGAIGSIFAAIIIM